MICPHCRVDISRLVRSAVKAAQVKTGSQGGKAGVGAAKRRNVNYQELGRLGAEARKRERPAYSIVSLDIQKLKSEVEPDGIY